MGRLRNFTAIEPALLNGTVRRVFPEMTDDQWAWWIFVQLYRENDSGQVTVGYSEASKHRMAVEQMCQGCTNTGQKTSALYRPFVDMGLARTCSDVGVAQGGGDFSWYGVLTVPTRFPDGNLSLGRLYDKEARELLPFVRFPNLKFAPHWAGLTHEQRRAIGSMYAFLSPYDDTSDPEHLRLEDGRLIASRSTLEAAGADASELHSSLIELTDRGLVTWTEELVKLVEVYPGSRPRLTIVKEGTGGREVYLPSPTVTFGPRRTRRWS